MSRTLKIAVLVAAHAIFLSAGALRILRGQRGHQLVAKAPWWIEFFKSQGFKNHRQLVSYFGDEWVRGPFQGAPGSFHLVLTRASEAAS